MPARKKKEFYNNNKHFFSNTQKHTTLITNRTLTDRTTDIIERGVRERERERKREFRKEIHASSLSVSSSS